MSRRLYIALRRLVLRLRISFVQHRIEWIGSEIKALEDEMRNCIPQVLDHYDERIEEERGHLQLLQAELQSL